MRIIVLGSKGQLGSDIAAMLDLAGFDIKRITRTELDAKSADIREILANLPQAEFIVNCIAFVNVDAAETEAEAAVAVNMVFVRELAIHCEKSGAKLIHFSTDFVFDGGSGQPYSEDDVMAPVNLYGLTKAAGELAIRGACSKYFILRVSALFGVQGASSKGGNFVETMIRLARSRGEVSVVTDQLTTPTHTLDVARVVCEIIANDSSAYGTYHCTGKGSCTWFDFAQEIFGLCQISVEMKRISIHQLEMKARRPIRSALRTQLLDSIYVMPPWQQGLKEYLKLKGHLKR